jgi:hypothetical protein
MCKKDDWSTGEVADAAEGPAIHARAIEDRPVDALDAPGQGLPPLKVDDVMFCRDDHCAILNSVPNECMKVVGDFRGRITQIRQGKGTHCKYYTSDKCDSAAIIHETTSNLNQDTSLVGALKGIAAITCEPLALSLSARPRAFVQVSVRSTSGLNLAAISIVSNVPIGTACETSTDSIQTRLTRLHSVQEPSAITSPATVESGCSASILLRRTAISP